MKVVEVWPKLTERRLSQWFKSALEKKKKS